MQPKAEHFTEMAWSAIVSAQNYAEIKKNQYIETEHLLLSLIDQNDLAKRILEKASDSIEKIKSSLSKFIEKQPQMRVKPDSLFLGKDLTQTFAKAEEIKKSFEDSYISIEHLLLALCDDKRCVKKIFEEEDINKEKLFPIITQIRGTHKVTDQNPEGKFESLEKLKVNRVPICKPIANQTRSFSFIKSWLSSIRLIDN